MKFFRGERPPIEDEPTIGEVYEWFGATSYAAQVLEQGLLNALVILDSKCRKVPEREWLLFYKNHEKDTLGRMLKKLSEKHLLPDGFSGQLAFALKERNRLAHSFFADHSESFGFANGRNRMIKDLDKMMTLFYKTDGVMTKLMQFQKQQVGITDEVIIELQKHATKEHLKKHPGG